ncbi:NAD(P)-dependent oxidoreductase [Streptomyces profundus]|uniref:NAD(P)-dependent oxidoreductase n=1 Tax=Streptomyces profundus TaxID=2867410 RepID=UPI001D163368|nr:NAD(P)-binding domain-containing protein [Streptomyces sp. MA3_2.13]UED84961.1 NAD(P)-binding domain-containing protein [Streptomyces sp. MA3_2.13]
MTDSSPAEATETTEAASATEAARAGEPVAVLGAGAMGSALAEALLAAGHPVTVWNRTPARTEPLVARGARAAPGVAAASVGAGIVVVCVTDPAAARSVLDEVPVDEGQVVVNLTTGSPEDAREAAALAERRGMTYLDGAIQAGAHLIGTPDALLMYAGREQVFRAHRETLLAFGEDTRYLGEDHGLPALFDLALLAFAYELWISYLHTLALIDTEGLTAGSFAGAARKIADDIVGHLDSIAAEVDDGVYSPDSFGRLQDHEAVADHLVAMRAARGVDAGQLRLVRDLIRGRIAEGRGEQGFSGIFEGIRVPRTGR